MRRPICWTERLEGGVKREVRVLFAGGEKIRWQTKRSDQEQWEYDITPDEADWQRLEENMEARYRRRNVPLKNLELVRRHNQNP